MIGFEFWLRRYSFVFSRHSGDIVFGFSAPVVVKEKSDHQKFQGVAQSKSGYLQLL